MYTNKHIDPNKSYPEKFVLAVGDIFNRVPRELFWIVNQTGEHYPIYGRTIDGWHRINENKYIIELSAISFECKFAKDMVTKPPTTIALYGEVDDYVVDVAMVSEDEWFKHI